MRHGHIRLMELLLDIEDLTKEPHTLERIKEALRIVEHPHIQLEDLLLNILKTTKEDYTLLSVKEALQIVQHPQHQLDGFEPYTD